MEINIQEQLPSIKLIKGQKDTYGWEIKVFGKDMEANLKQLKEVNTKLTEQFCNNGESK